mmetsp:Transcript_55571/g.121723  ORF Transcript_55571/g.121723 Transcript_55571/m.121723 type:complete len:410 (+) Transcript_55571:340-1569(+)
MTMVGGAMSILTAGLAGCKVTAVVLPVSVLTVANGAVWAYSSIGFLWFLSKVLTQSVQKPPIHAPVAGSKTTEDFPCPEHLNLKVLNWAVVGRVGVGKSTFINTLRGIGPTDEHSAPVGVIQTTMRPTPYSFVGSVKSLTTDMVRIWDLPGAGTVEWPFETYVRDMGLRYFDGVVLMTSDAWTEHDLELVLMLQKFQVPFYMVRNKVDQDIRNNEEDFGMPATSTVSQIREDLKRCGVAPSRIFLICAKKPATTDLEFGQLVKALGDDLGVRRAPRATQSAPEAVIWNFPAVPESFDDHSASDAAPVAAQDLEEDSESCSATPVRDSVAQDQQQNLRTPAAVASPEFRAQSPATQNMQSRPESIPTLTGLPVPEFKLTQPVFAFQSFGGESLSGLEPSVFVLSGSEVCV